MTSAPDVQLQWVLSFDGSSHVDIGEWREHELLYGVTLEAWVYVEAHALWTGIVSKLFDTQFQQSGYAMLLDGMGGACFAIKPSMRDIRYYSSGLGTIEPRTWCHIAFTYDGRKMKTYVNGRLTGKQSEVPSFITYSPRHTLSLGRYHDDRRTLGFTGMLAEVRLWEKARSTTQILKTMHKRLKGNETDLVGYWPLNEGSGEVVHDASRHGRHGTSCGTTWQEAPVPLYEKGAIPKVKPTTKIHQIAEFELLLDQPVSQKHEGGEQDQHPVASEEDAAPAQERPGQERQEQERQEQERQEQERQEQIVSLERDLDARNAELASLQHDLHARDDQLASLQRDLHARDDQLASLQRDLAARDEKLASLQRDYEASNELRASLQRDYEASNELRASLQRDYEASNE
ncbi:MAG: LamG-like jellyroll fold domain-containing protein, partial [Myxococcota bacterium]